MLLFTNSCYHSVVSEEAIRFFRQEDEDWMEWKGVGWEKLGTWSIVQHPEKTMLEFRYNYAREESYIFTVLASRPGEVISFRLEDARGRSWDFMQDEDVC